MRKIIGIAILSTFSAIAFAQLSTDQKKADFQELAGLFAKRYAFIEWKQSAIGYNGLDLTPWLSQINDSMTDLDYLNLCAKYVAQYQDGHTAFELPSDFEAHLGFTADTYDGKTLIDSIDHSVLPIDQYPFVKGDELVSIDGVATSDFMDSVVPFVGEGNPRSARRVAAAFLTDRYQAFYPQASAIGATAAVVIRRQNGDLEKYTIPWQTFGLPIRRLVR